VTTTAVPASAERQSLVPVLVLGAVAGLQTADPIISSVALVKASADLHFSASTEALAASISTLALASTVIAAGLLADRIGRRRLLVLALLVTIVGDLAVAVSHGAPLYLAGRAVTGVGLGGVFGAAFAFIQEVAPDNVGGALGQFGATAGLVTMVAGVAGGTLASTSWRLAYLVIPLLSLMGVGLVLALLPRIRGQRGRPVDVPGLILIAVGVIGILYGVSNAASKLVTPRTWLPILVGVVALAVYVVIERRSDHPVFPLELFKNPVFVGSVLVVLCWNLAQAAVVLQLSNVWQYIAGYSPTQVSFGQLPVSLVGIASSIIVGRSLKKGKTERSRNVLGLSLVAVGFLWLGLAQKDFGYLYYLPGILLIGYGLPYAVVASGRLFMSEAPPGSFGPVTSSKTTIGQFGYAFGLAGSMVVVSNVTILGVEHKLQAAGVPPSQTGQGLDDVTNYANTGRVAPGELAHRALHLASGTYFHAFDLTMLVAAFICAATAAAAWVLLGRRHPPTVVPEPAPAVSLPID
jgi:MFS family permease